MWNKQQTKKQIRQLVFVSIFLCFVVQTVCAVQISTNTINLSDLFPKQTQGENGIWLQARSPGTSDYTDLINGGNYAWISPGYYNSAPKIYRGSGYNSNRMFALPSTTQNDGLYRDTVMRVQIENDVSLLEIYGATGNDAYELTSFIYKGADNWNNPLWVQTWVGAWFDLKIPVSAGDELFFDTHYADPSYNHGSDPSWTIEFTGIVVPEPSVCILLATVWLAFFVGKRMARSRR
jgi:hypothetical protein